MFAVTGSSTLEIITPRAIACESRDLASTYSSNGFLTPATCECSREIVV